MLGWLTAGPVEALVAGWRVEGQPARAGGRDPKRVRRAARDRDQRSRADSLWRPLKVLDPEVDLPLEHVEGLVVAGLTMPGG